MSTAERTCTTRPRRATATGSSSWGVPVRLGQHRVLRPGRRLWLRTTSWLLLLLFLSAAAFGLPLQAAVDLFAPDNGPLQLLGVLVAGAMALGCYALAVRIGERQGAGELALRPALPGILVGAGVGVAMMTVLMAVVVGAGLENITLVGPTPAWTGLGSALQAAVTEELWMRALLFRLLWRTLGPVPAFALAAAVFGALHLANRGVTPLALVTVAVAGVMFCALYTLTGRLWVPIGVHVGWNLAQGWLFGAAVSGVDLGGSVAVSSPRPGVPGWLTGGTFGPEASPFALLVVGAVTVGALVLARRAGRLTGGPNRRVSSVTSTGR